MKSYTYTIFSILIVLFSSCVQETHLKTLNFKVDMRNVDTIINPGVKGQFKSPSWQEKIPLTDNDNDGIYEATAQIKAAQYSIQFKFINNDIYELQNQDNRFVKLEYKPETITYKCVFNNPKGGQSNQ